MPKQLKSSDITDETEQLMKDYNSGKIPHPQFADRLAILKLVNDKLLLTTQALELAQYYEQERIAHLIARGLVGQDITHEDAILDNEMKMIEEEKDFDLWLPFTRAVSYDEFEAFFKDPEKSRGILSSQIEKAEKNLRELKERLRRKADLEGKESFELHQLHSHRNK